MNTKEWNRAWAEKERLDRERREYEENCAWAAFNLWFRRIIVILILTGLIYWAML